MSRIKTKTLKEKPAKRLRIIKTQRIRQISHRKRRFGQHTPRLLNAQILQILIRRKPVSQLEQTQKMIFRQERSLGKVLQVYFFPNIRMDIVDRTREPPIQFHTGTHPDRRQLLNRLADIPLLLQQVAKQVSQLLFKKKPVKSVLLMSLYYPADDGIKMVVSAMKLVEELKDADVLLPSLFKNTVRRCQQSVEHRLCEMFPKMDVEGLSRAASFDLQRIRLAAVADKISVLVNPSRKAVHPAKTIPPYIEEKRERSLYSRPETSLTAGMDNDTGKSLRIQRKVAPTQLFTKALVDLAF